MNKTNIAAIISCVLLFIIWYPLMQHLGWLETAEKIEGQEEKKTQIITDKKEKQPSSESATKQTEDTQKPDQQFEKPQQESQTKTQPPSGTEKSRPFPRTKRPALDQTTTLKQPEFFTATVDQKVGGILQVELTQYKTYDTKKPVVIGKYRFPYCSLSLSESGYPLAANSKVIKSTPNHFALERTSINGEITVVEHWKLENQQGYRINYRIELKNQTDQPLTIRNMAVSIGGMTKHKAKAAKLSRIGRVDLAAELASNKKETPASYTFSDVKDMERQKAQQIQGKELIWAALHNKYFLFYLGEDSVKFKGTTLDTYQKEIENSEETEKWLYAQALLPNTEVPANSQKVITFDGYAGPKEFKRLNEINRGLESIMRLDLFMFFRADWMSWISKTILRALVFFQGMFNTQWGYGVAIIFITIIVKLLFWPLTHKSTVSMRRMQKIQPLVKEIREQYKDEPQKMNRKVMELYREHKVNPLGGCLPILFQIPVFFALFNTLRGAIELRQASFLWVADLSMPDTLPWLLLGLPIRPLAILMGVTMFIQQYLSPSSGDPSQKRMMYFMTIFFMFIFYTMPAGLTLYWTTNQVLTIIQNLFISKLETTEGETKNGSTKRTT